MSDTLLYYKPSALVEKASPEFPGTIGLTAYTRLYSAGAIPCDRTGTIRTPLRITPLFPIPAFREMRRSLEDICNERARELLARADRLETDIYVLWSGGIDSTLALTSLLKESSPAQRARLVVLLSQRSIEENHTFYESFIRGTLRTDTSRSLPLVLGTPKVLVSGEHNDQLFGSDIMASLITKHGAEIIHAPYDPEILRQHFREKLRSDELASFYVDLFGRLPAASPVPIESLFEFTWWINFALKWQTVYTRTLTYTAPEHTTGITQAYLRDYYAPFFNTEDFQLWSLNNKDKRIRDSWSSYKWPCKDIIYDFTKDTEYRDHKLKVGSLAAFMKDRKSFKVLDSRLGLHEEFDIASFYNPENDFVAADRLVA